ncbi:MAG TPA: DUF4157 domain-containing protein [Candidatus Nitrosopolaris rasttigaisensis]|nr:DUF4157 domain-containing protein [Candidatus Nitrosopolaris rasttigaisensis]
MRNEILRGRQSEQYGKKHPSRTDGIQLKSFIPLRDLGLYRSQSAPPLERVSRHAPDGLPHDSKWISDLDDQTGIPKGLKASMEFLSGLSLDKIRVHYNSLQPVQLGTRAFTEGNHIYVSPGEERCLPHELGHAIQQMQGRAKPTSSGEIKMNADRALEREAHQMGKLALELSNYPMPVLLFVRDFTRSAQYYKEMSRPDQLNTAPKDVIQKYTIESGEFENRASQAAKDLKVVRDNLARNAKCAIDRYDNDPYTSRLD